MTKYKDLYPITHIFLSRGTVAHKIFCSQRQKNSVFHTFLLIAIFFRKNDDARNLGAIMLLKYSNLSASHYVKSVRVWSFSGPYFPIFGLSTESYTEEKYGPDAGKYGPEKLRIDWIGLECLVSC